MESIRGIFLFVLFCCGYSAAVYSKDEVSFHIIRCTQLKDASEHIMKALNETSDHAYTGGNSNWEHSRLVDYEDSEVRFHDIIGKACDLVANQALCHEIMEYHESDLLPWWKQNWRTVKDFYIEFFVKHTQDCCPSGHFGLTCNVCNGLVDGKPCNSHGTCDGDGSRVGEGTCSCNPFFEGVECDRCIEGQYMENKICKPCSKACFRGCTGPAPENCLHKACSEGYSALEVEGCEDVDECKNPSTCSPHTYCVNHIGTFNCINCDESCETCTGVTNGHCITCAAEYKNSSGICTLINPPSETKNEENAVECDKACNGCTDVGADKCTSCAKGYELKNGVCEEVNIEMEDDDDEENVSKEKSKSHKKHDETKHKKKDKKKKSKKDDVDHKKHEKKDKKSKDKKRKKEEVDDDEDEL